jgi:hypothetical protein
MPVKHRSNSPSPRHIALAYNRVSQGNYSLSGLVGRQLGGKTVGRFLYLTVF